MTKYREILRLQSLGFSERNIAQSCGVSRNTVARVLKKAAEINISWPLDFDMTDSALEELMFPRDKSATNKRMPDFNYIRKELLRNGVNKKLLWVEYCEECRMSNEEPLISDVSWYELTRQLEYKAKWNGRKYIKIDTFYASSQLCSVCGYQNPDTKDLSVRTWICPKCGAEHDRDINAAKNILTEGLRQIA